MGIADTYAVLHMGETLYMKGSTAAARWACDNYGLPLDRMPRLVEQLDASPELRNPDLGLYVMNVSAPSRTFSTPN